MIRKSLFLAFISATMAALLAGCSSNTSTPATASTAEGVPVSVSMTDDPPTGVSVLFFQVSLTNATLTSSSGATVSLLGNNNTPVQVDVTQLQALSAFLSTASVTPGTYSGLSLTFANPELVIYNASDSSLAGTCAVGSVCEIAPTVDDSATVNLTSSPFPVTVSQSSPLGFLVDFHLNTVIQSDLSVNLGVSNGITLAELPQASSQPQYGSLSGTVESVNASQTQFTVQTPWGRTFTIATTSSTAYDNFPTSACATAGIACLADGQDVQLQITSVATGGVLTASQVTYLQAATQQTAEGTILALNTSGATPTMKLLLHYNPSGNSNLPLGGVATVSLASNATFSVDSNGFTLPSGLTFSSASDLVVGQQVLVDVVSGSLSSTSQHGFAATWGPPQSASFSTDSVQLEPSQMSGSITALDSSSSSFTLGGNGGQFFFPWPMMSPNAVSYNVLTTTQTTYQGLTTDSFDGLSTGNVVSVNGWLFPPASSGGPATLAAQTVVLHPSGMF